MAESSSTQGKKGKKNKNLLIALGIGVVGVAIFLIMRRKASSNVFLNITNYPASKYAPLTDAQIKAKLDEANGLVASKGVDGAISDLQSQIASYEAQGTPESLAYAQLLKDFVSDLQLQQANEIRSASMASMSSGSMTTTSNGSMTSSGSGSMSIADNAMVNDGTNVTIPSTSGSAMVDNILGETKSTITPSPLTNPALPQLNADVFNLETYGGIIPQATIDSRLQQANASVLANGVPATVSSLLAESNTLANSTNATDKAVAQLLYDMAVTLDIANNPANASKYAVVRDANYWRNYYLSRPSTFDLSRELYLKWTSRGIKFTEPTESQYGPLPYTSSRTNFLKNLVTTNGREAVLSNVIFNLTPSGNIVSNRTPALRNHTNWQTT